MQPTARIAAVASLSEVERPASASDRYGPQLIARIEGDSGITRYSFEDRLVRALFRVNANTIDFSIENRTEHSIRLIWDEATLVLPQGTPSAVMHTGIRYTDCAGSKPPSVIPKGVTLTDFVIPCNRLGFVSAGVYSGWGVDHFIDGWDKSYPEPLSSELVTSLTNGMVGKQLMLLLPLQIEGVTNEYSFRFKVDSLLVQRAPTYR